MWRRAGTARLPAHLIAHGGSFCSGTIGQLDALCSEYATTVDCVVVDVGYRLAPEHPWPTAPEDYYAALLWRLAGADGLHVDPDRVSVGGASAGAGIAAAVAMMARDRGGPELAFQLLEIPVLDLTMSMRSTQRFARGYLLTREELMRGYATYVPDPARRTEPYASPMLASNLTGLPPAMVLTCQYDPLRDEGEEYARRLQRAGVPTELLRARGHVHSSTYSSMSSAARYRRLTAGALRRALWP